ncbi:Gaa1-like, GPI transamidase component [Ancylostoma caninum]|uniref:Gaa1-like, GPI transamidase component n=1 Tax=Ancylostoma caninum TaxID=29170 RepID=A0A368GU68_ANCCA|nr:Gaa1-like, GPI transamidase component [Ancylostoma caninum]
MPGLVTERFDKDGLAAEYLQGLREHVNNKQDYICKCLQDAGLSCHKQRWWSTVRVTNASGTNVYAVLRAPRATGVEAMLFAVDLTQREAAAMVMAYAAFARQQVYWARDLFFVFVDGGAPGMDAWLSEYHLVEDNALQGDALPEMGGVMIGGVVMKSQATKSTKDPIVRIELNHLNGQLPNLDLFNSVVRIAGKGKFALHSTVYGVRDIEQGGSDWHMLVPLRAMYTQAFVAVEGIHSVMGKYGVQAVTVAVPPLVSYPLRHSTRLLEAIARSLNNVLERFHQSYFLYILASTDNFVSIAYFMPIIGGILLPLLMFAYRDWTYLTSLTVPRTWLIMHAIGLCTWMISTKYFAEYGENAKNDVIFLGMSTLVPWGLIIPTPVTEIQSLRFFLLLECSLAAAAVSLLNFSLALSFAVVGVPVLIKFTQDNEIRPRALLRTALALACHPAGIYALFLVYGKPYLGYGGKAVSLEVDTFTNALLRLVKEHLVYGSHVLPLLLVLVLPMWNLVLPLALVRLKLVQHTVTEDEETVDVPKDKEE